MSNNKQQLVFQQLVDHLRNDKNAAEKLVADEPWLLEYSDDTGRLALHWAASIGYLSFIQLAIGTDANSHLVTVADTSNWTPLMIASSAGHLEIVKYFLGFSLTDVNHQNLNGQTSLHYACSKNHFEIAKLLIENGAKVNVRDKYGATPLHRAVSQDNREKLVSYLLTVPLIQVNLTDLEGNSPLHCACEDGHESAALCLVQNGKADLYLLNKDEKTPFDMISSAEFRRKIKAAFETVKQSASDQ